MLEKPMKVAVLGAAGGIGQSLSLLLKLQLPAGLDLALYDVSPVTPGVAKDLSHIPTGVRVKGYAGEDPTEALTGADVVLIAAGVARKPGMTREDLFQVNAGIVKNLVQKVVEICPSACIAIITNPVNSIVPVAAETLKKAGIYDKRKLFGVTTLDVIRAETFVTEAKNLNVERYIVPVIGGHSGVTILPLLSKVPYVDFSAEEIEQLTHRIRNAGTEVVEAKVGGGSATLSMAQAAARFVHALVRALRGETVVLCSYVEGNGEFAKFFAQPLRLGQNGVAELLPIGRLSDYEQKALDELLPILNSEIKLGEDFVNGVNKQNSQEDNS